MATDIEKIAVQVLEKESQMFGHTAIPQDRLIKKMSDILGQAEEVLRADIKISELITHRKGAKGSMLSSLAKSKLLETQVAEQLDRLIKTFRIRPNAKVFKKEHMRLGRSVLLSDEQMMAVNNAVGSGVSIITGGPGTGKTTMVLGLVRALKSLDLSINLCAPTGKAAKRLGDATGLQKFRPTTIHRYLGSVYNATNKTFDVMIIDEASMLDINLLHNLLSTIPDGAQIILIGDKDQLPPVAPGQPFKDVITRFIGLSGSQNEFIEAKPTDGVSAIVSAAYDVIRGHEPSPDFNISKHGFEFVECEKDEIANTVLEYYFREIPKALNREFSQVQDEIQILSPQRKGSVGLTALNIDIQNRLTSRGSPLFERAGKFPIRYFKNDRVIQTGNDYKLGVMNGEIGTVLSETEEGLTINFEGRPVIYAKDQVNNIELAHSISIHKSQGSEYTAVIIPISSEHTFMLSRNLIYTALTRGKIKVCLIGQRAVFKNALKNGFKGSRYTGLNLELDKLSIVERIATTRLTEVYRQKKS